MFHHFFNPIKKFRKTYFPGIVTGSADDDPSAVSTYSVVGATTGFSQLWLLLVSTPLVIAIQYMSAKIGDVTKKGLITLIKENFGRRLAFICVGALVLANLLTLIADIVGMAAGLQLLTDESYIYFIIPLIIFVWYVIVFDNYQKIARYFFWFSGILLAYIISGILAQPDWLAILKSFIIPKATFNISYIMAALAMLGTTFSPYAFFWQTEEEIEEKHDTRQIKPTNRSVSLGFIYSNVIAFFIIVAAANTILNNNVNFLTVKDIAQALAPLAGGWATKLFGVGLVGSGLLAIPILASSSAYAVAELFKWPLGLNKKPSRAKGFYGVITFGFLLCLVALIFNLHPIRIMFFSQVLVGILTPLIIYFILRIASSKKIMGNYRCHSLSLAAGWITIVVLALGALALIYFII
jgi:NRAMP (natural resistance-associated macrophage protein)-like metal ion transporter